RTGEPDQRFALARRETKDCLAEELRHLDADDIYAEALTGIERVTYE
ncbi:oxidoreductase, partial [Nocardia seriolae]